MSQCKGVKPAWNKQCIMIKFPTTKNNPPIDIHWQMKVVYCYDRVAVSTVRILATYVCYTNLRYVSLNDRQHSTGPQTANDKDNWNCNDGKDNPSIWMTAKWFHGLGPPTTIHPTIGFFWPPCLSETNETKGTSQKTSLLVRLTLRHLWCGPIIKT
jgi:hypothetical protein